MIGPLGRQGLAATHGEHCPQMTRNPDTNALAWLQQKLINQLIDEKDCIYDEVVLQKKDLKLKICHPLRYNMSHGFHLFVVMHWECPLTVWVSNKWSAFFPWVM